MPQNKLFKTYSYLSNNKAILSNINKGTNKIRLFTSRGYDNLLEIKDIVIE